MTCEWLKIHTQHKNSYFFILSWINFGLNKISSYSSSSRSKDRLWVLTFSHFSSSKKREKCFSKKQETLPLSIWYIPVTNFTSIMKTRDLFCYCQLGKSRMNSRRTSKEHWSVFCSSTKISLHYNIIIKLKSSPKKDLKRRKSGKTTDNSQNPFKWVSLKIAIRKTRIVSFQLTHLFQIIF